jgi:hypothetical protein
MDKRATPRLGGVAMPLDRYGAAVASGQSPILCNGKITNTLVFSLVQAIPKGPRLGSHRPTPEGPRHPHDGVVSFSYHAIGAKRKTFPHTPASGVPESGSTLKPDEPDLFQIPGFVPRTSERRVPCSCLREHALSYGAWCIWWLIFSIRPGSSERRWIRWAPTGGALPALV